MLRVANVVEKNTVPAPPNPVTVAATTATDVLPDISQSIEEFIGRYIFNDSGTAAYYAFGQDADNVNSYHGKLADQQQLDCSNIASRVSIYSVTGGKFVPTVLRRQDLIQHETIFEDPKEKLQTQSAPTIVSDDDNRIVFTYSGVRPWKWLLIPSNAFLVGTKITQYFQQFDPDIRDITFVKPDSDDNHFRIVPVDGEFKTISNVSAAFILT